MHLFMLKSFFIIFRDDEIFIKFSLPQNGRDNVFKSKINRD